MICDDRGGVLAGLWSLRGRLAEVPVLRLGPEWVIRSAGVSLELLCT